MKYVMGVENCGGWLLHIYKDIDKEQLKKEILAIGKYVEMGDLDNPNIIIQTYPDDLVMRNHYEKQLQFSYEEALEYVNRLEG